MEESCAGESKYFHAICLASGVYTALTMERKSKNISFICRETDGGEENQSGQLLKSTERYNPTLYHMFERNRVME